jgi:probable rRNA maturation factor
VIEVEVVNRSGEEVDEAGAVELARSVLAGEGVGAGELGVAFVGADESRALKREHLGIDEATDALAFPLDGLEAVPDGLPRQLGDVVVCPDRAEADGTPVALLLVHGVLHLVGHDHEADNGDMLRRQEAIFDEVEPVAAVRSS